MHSAIPQRGEKIDVGVGELAVARQPDILVTSALGSCVGVALWDPFTLSGGLAHVMLPKQYAQVSESENLEGRYAETAIPLLVELLGRQGSPRRRLLAKIAGGAAMFIGDASGSQVGERNVEAVREQLAALHIPIRGEDVGGRHARTVELHMDSGTLVVRSYAYGIREL